MLRRARRFEDDGGGGRRPAPLEDGDGETAGPVRRQGETQGRDGGFGGGPQGAEQEGGGAAGRGGHLEAAYGTGVGLGRPAEHGIGGTAGQGLFGGPEGILLGGGRNDDEARQIHAGGGPGGRMKGVRRADHEGPAAARPDGLQGGHQQGQFAEAGAVHQQFAEGAPGPAAAGQLGVQGGMAAGHDGQRGGGEAVAAPDVGPGEDFGQGTHYRALPLRMRPTARPSMARGPSTTMGA